MTDMVHRHPGLLDPAVVREVRTLAEVAEQHDGVEALGEQTLLNAGDPGAAVVHLTIRGDGGPDGGGALLGYAQLDQTGTAELVVTPSARRRGLGSALLAAVRAEARRAEVERPRVWAHGNLPPARALAARAGMSVVRELWQMSLDLGARPSTPTPAPPADVTVRPFVVGRDEEAWLTVNARAFATHPEQGRMTLADLHARQAEPWFDAADLLLAERDGRLLASAWMKVEPGGSSGELYALGVDPDAQGAGLGRLLTAKVLDHLAAKGLRTATLYTEADNTAAVRTYTAAGFTTTRSDVQYA